MADASPNSRSSRNAAFAAVLDGTTPPSRPNDGSSLVETPIDDTFPKYLTDKGKGDGEEGAYRN